MEDEGEIEISLSRQMVLTVIFSVAGLVLGETPIGYIKIGGALEITLLHIPVILATIFGGLVPGVFTGLVFGLSSFVKNLTTANSFGNFFVNPLVSILPRVMFPAVVYLVYKVLNSLPHLPRVVCGIVAAAVGTFAHTLLVMMSIFAFYGETFLKELDRRRDVTAYIGAFPGMKSFVAVMGSALKNNGLLEVAAAVFVVAVGFAILYTKELFDRRSPY